MASSTSNTEQLVNQFLARLYSLGLQENPDERTIMVMESGLRNLRETRARTFSRMYSSILPQQAAGAIEPPLVELPPVPFLDKDQVALEPALALGLGLGLGFGWPADSRSGPGSGFGGSAGGGGGAGASATGATGAMAPAAATARLQQCVFVLEPMGELQPRVQELLGRQLSHAIVHRAGATIATTSGAGVGVGVQQLSPGSVQSFDEHESGGSNGNGAPGGSQLAAGGLSGEELHASLTLTRSTHSSTTGPGDNPQATAVNPEWRFLFGMCTARDITHTRTLYLVHYKFVLPYLPRAHSYYLINLLQIQSNIRTWRIIA